MSNLRKRIIAEIDENDERQFDDLKTIVKNAIEVLEPVRKNMKGAYSDYILIAQTILEQYNPKEYLELDQLKTKIINIVNSID